MQTPADIVTFAAMCAEKLREYHEHAVPGLVTVSIIDILEAIEVDEREAEVASIALSAGDLVAETVVEDAAVRDTGQRIG